MEFQRLPFAWVQLGIWERLPTSNSPSVPDWRRKSPASDWPACWFERWHFWAWAFWDKIAILEEWVLWTFGSLQWCCSIWRELNLSAKLSASCRERVASCQRTKRRGNVLSCNLLPCCAIECRGESHCAWSSQFYWIVVGVELNHCSRAHPNGSMYLRICGKLSKSGELRRVILSELGIRPSTGVCYGTHWAFLAVFAVPLWKSAAPFGD